MTANNLQVITATDTLSLCPACVSLYSREADPEAPIYIESARFRTTASGMVVSPGDSLVYNEMRLSVKNVRFHQSCCRMVVDAVRVSLDPALVQSLELYTRKPRYGSTSDEVLELVRTVQVVIAHDAEISSLTHNSRQLLGRYRVYMDQVDAKDLDQMSVLKGAETYKVSSVRDLNLIGKMPYALVERTNQQYAK